MPRRSPLPFTRGLALGARWVLPFAAMLTVLGLLGSCTGERPTLGPANPGGLPTSTTSTTPGSSSSTTTAPPKQAKLGPDDLLGYIATPIGKPQVFAEPNNSALPLDVPAKTGAGAPTTLAVVGNASKIDGGWFEVLLPTRPNRTVGWVAAPSVAITKTDQRVFVDLPARSLRVERAGATVFTGKVAIGDSVNPTPVGATYVTELIDNNDPSGAYGPYAFGLALHSDTLSEFGGGDGQVGIHGTNQPALIGQAVSHGCVRLTNADVQKLVDLKLPLGVPVFIS